MHPSSSASSSDTEYHLRHARAAAQHAAGDEVGNEEEQAPGVPGSPPKVLERRDKTGFTGFTEVSGMEVDNREDDSPSRGQKRKRDLSGDMHERHSPPKFRHVDRDDGQAPSSSCKVAVPGGAACSQPIFDADGLVTGSAIEGKGTASGNAPVTGSATDIGSPACAGARFDDVDNEGNAPLHQAARHGLTETVRLLLKFSVQADRVNDDGNTPLHLAAFKGHAEAVDLLLKAGAKVNRPDGDGDTPLHLAACDGDIETVKVLLAAGAWIDEVNSEGSTPLHLAVFNGHAAAVDLMLKAGAEVDQPDGDGDAPLYLASSKGHAETIDLLLKAGAWVDKPDRDGNTPMHRASFKGHVEAVNLLIRAGAQLDLPGSEGNAPLHLAAFKGHVEVVDLLSEAGAQVDQPGNKGNMPMHRAASHGNAETVRSFLARGAQADRVNDDGDTPLHLAVCNGHAEAVDLLLKAGAQADRPDGDGDTPLFLAFINGHANVVRLLLPTRTEIRYRSLAARPPGPYNNLICGTSLVDADLLGALEIALEKEDVPLVELSLAHWMLSLPNHRFPLVSTAAFPFPLPTPFSSPVHDLLLCGPATAPGNMAVAPEMIDTLVAIFDACSTSQMTPQEMDDALRATGLLGPVIDELAGQFWHAPQLMQAMAGNLPLTPAQIRQAIGGMLAELDQFLINWPQPYQPPERRTALAMNASRSGTPVPWVSEEGQAHLTRSLAKQVQALAELGRQAESDELGEGISNLLALCLKHMPAESAANAAALRCTLTTKLGMYGSLADKTVQAWQAMLAEGAVAGASVTGTTAAVAGWTMLETFAQGLQARLDGAATYSQVRSHGAIDEAQGQIMTQLMMRQWTMLEQYWKGAAAESEQ